MWRDTSLSWIGRERRSARTRRPALLSLWKRCQKMRPARSCGVSFRMPSYRDPLRHRRRSRDLARKPQMKRSGSRRVCCMRVFVCEAVAGGGDVLKGGEYDVSVEVTRPYVLNEMREPPS